MLSAKWDLKRNKPRGSCSITACAKKDAVIVVASYLTDFFNEILTCFSKPLEIANVSPLLKKYDPLNLFLTDIYW